MRAWTRDSSGRAYLARGARNGLGRTERYSQIGRILVRRGLLPYLRGGRRAELRTLDGRARLDDSVRLAVEEGDVTFVKLGQALATSRDLLADEFVTWSTAGACGSATVARKRAGGHGAERPAVCEATGADIGHLGA